MLPMYILMSIVNTKPNKLLVLNHLRNGLKKQAIAPAVAARRRVVQLIGDKEAMRVLFGEIAPRFEDRQGGYTRVVRLAGTRIGDSGQQAILEFVGTHDRERQASEKPEFDVTDQDAVDTPDDEQTGSDSRDIESEESNADVEVAQPEEADDSAAEVPGDEKKED